MPPDAFTRLDAVARHLPFGVLDVDAANAAFARWRQSGTQEDQREVDLWAYCFIRRYFLTQFLRERGTASDLDACISKALLNVRKHYEGIDPERFASYVSVACRRTLLNHRRGRREATDLPDSLADPTQTTTAGDLDPAVVRRVIEAVLQGLPTNVGRVGRLRILDDVPYPDIADRLGLPLPTTRTYASRAIAALREDPGVRALCFDDLLPPNATSETPPFREAS
ncbi:MAG: sigma-70 family RNA polymerase sigma factor [Bacteroidota bacterium]